ncbi:hypothetical protein OXX79_001680 [Metschnikowia pulcherrima]
MSAPAIPGFSYDPERKRYFKITNGDQRLNAAYSNNAVQAEERRAQHRDLQEQKHTKKIDDVSKTGLIFERNRRPRNFSQWLLQRKQGEVMPNPGLNERLPPAAIEGYSSPVWPFPYLNGYLRARNGCLAFIHKDDFMRPDFVGDLSSARLSDSEDSSAPCRISRVETYKGWVSCLYGKSLKILRWSLIEGTRHVQFTNFTTVFDRKMEKFCESEDWEELYPKLLNAGLLARFYDGFLIVYSSLGYEIKMGLKPFRVEDIHVTPLSHVLFFKEHDTFCRAGKNFYFVTGGIVAVRSSMVGEKDWDFRAAIHGFYVTVLGVAQEEARHLVRMYVVTAKAIIIRDFLEESLKRVASDVVIPICNDNQAFPLIHKMEEYILVEEGEGLFKVVDTKRLITKTVKVNIKLASPRVTMPRMFESKNQSYIADSKSTYLLGNALQFRILVDRKDLESDVEYEDSEPYDSDTEVPEIEVSDSDESDLRDRDTSDSSRSDMSESDWSMSDSAPSDFDLSSNF